MASTKKLDCDFDSLLLEAWELCTDDEEFRSSAAYCCIRRLLGELTSCSARGEDEFARLERAVCGIRAGDYADLVKFLEQDGGGGVKKLPAQQSECKMVSRTPQPTSAECALVAALAANEPCEGLPQFFRDVAVHTCDRGALLMKITGLLLSDFGSFADAVLGYRVTQIGMVLAREQTSAHGRFHDLALRASNRAQMAVARVKDVMPTFDWRRYVAEAGYLKLVVASTCTAQADDMEGADDARDKGLLYQLNWLRSEIDRADAENRCLQEQHTTLATELAGINRDIAQEQDRAADEIGRLSDELDALRGRSATQMCVLDKLMETCQIAMQNSTKDSSGAEACKVKSVEVKIPPQTC